MRITILISSKFSMQTRLLSRVNVLFSRVNGIDVHMSCDDLAKFLDIFVNLSLHLCTFPKITPESVLQISSTMILIPLSENENVTLFAPLSQVIAKIIVYNIVPSPDECDHARGCTSLLIYYIPSFIPANLSKLIFDIIIGPNIASKNLPFDMLLTLLFKH